MAGTDGSFTAKTDGERWRWLLAAQAYRNQLPSGNRSSVDRDYFSIPEEEIGDLESVLTVVDGKVVYAGGPYSELSPEIPTVVPEWSPVKYYGGYQK